MRLAALWAKIMWSFILCWRDMAELLRLYIAAPGWR
jgi:hypothetical protein